MKILSLFLLALLLAGCGGATNELKCYKSVKERFPNNKIYYLDGWEFLVMTDSCLYRVETQSVFNPGITDIEYIEPIN